MTPNKLLDIVIAAEKIRDFCCDQTNCAYCPAWTGEGRGCGFEAMPYEWADLILKLEDIKTMENEKNCESCLYNVLDPAFPPCSECIGQGGEKDNWADENSDGLDCEECKL